MLVMECVPTTLGQEVTRALDIPVVGIGAGPGCDGQVLVLHDLLGVSGKTPKFAKDFLRGNPGGIEGAITAYCEAVRGGHFPDAEHSFD
jgi:3-methyl-2-oxobutanoate hydroxymethyltransferase